MDLVAQCSNHRFLGPVIRRALGSGNERRPDERGPAGASTAHRLSQRLGPDGIAAVTAAYRGGETASAIAKRFGISRQSVNILAADAGLSRKVPRTTSEQQDEIIRLYQTGLSQQAVADAVGFSQTSVHLVLMRRGIPARSAIAPHSA